MLIDSNNNKERGPGVASRSAATVTAAGPQDCPERDSDIDSEEPPAVSAVTGVIYHKDPGCWPDIVNEDMRHYWINTGPVPCQNRDSDFSESERQYKHQKRSFSKNFFSRKLANGEIVPREWLLYSPAKGSAFCFASWLFPAIL